MCCFVYSSIYRYEITLHDANIKWICSFRPVVSLECSPLAVIMAPEVRSLFIHGSPSLGSISGWSCSTAVEASLIFHWCSSMAGQVQGVSMMYMLAQMSFVIVITGTFVHVPTKEDEFGFCACDVQTQCTLHSYPSFGWLNIRWGQCKTCSKRAISLGLQLAKVKLYILFLQTSSFCCSGRLYF